MKIALLALLVALVACGHAAVKPEPSPTPEATETPLLLESGYLLSVTGLMLSKDERYIQVSKNCWKRVVTYTAQKYLGGPYGAYDVPEIHGEAPSPAPTVPPEYKASTEQAAVAAYLKANPL